MSITTVWKEGVVDAEAQPYIDIMKRELGNRIEELIQRKTGGLSQAIQDQLIQKDLPFTMVFMSHGTIFGNPMRVICVYESTSNVEVTVALDGSRLKTMKERIEVLEGQAKSKDKQIEDQAAHIKHLKKKVASGEDEVKSKDKQVSALKENIEDQNTRIKHLLEEVEQRCMTTITQQTTINNLKRDLKDLQTDLASLKLTTPLQGAEDLKRQELALEAFNASLHAGVTHSQLQLLVAESQRRDRGVGFLQHWFRDVWTKFVVAAKETVWMQEQEEVRTQLWTFAAESLERDFTAWQAAVRDAGGPLRTQACLEEQSLENQKLSRDNNELRSKVEDLEAAMLELKTLLVARVLTPRAGNASSEVDHSTPCNSLPNGFKMNKMPGTKSSSSGEVEVQSTTTTTTQVTTVKTNFTTDLLVDGEEDDGSSYAGEEEG